MPRIDTDLLGLQIVSMKTATVVGEVDALVIEDETLKVVGFLVDLGLREASVLPFGDARAVGEDAIIIADADAIVPISAVGPLEALAEKGIVISGATAITESGADVGAVGDFYVDTETGAVTGLEFLAEDQEVYPKESAVLPVSTVRRLGVDLVILRQDYDQHLLKDGSSLERVGGTQPASTPPRTVAPEPAPEPEQAPESDLAAEPEPELALTPEPEPAPEPTVEVERAPEEPKQETQLEEPDAEKGEEEEDTFSSQQKHFLIGKKVLRRIESPSGEVIAEEGTEVTSEMIKKAKAADQLLILSLNVE